MTSLANLWRAIEAVPGRADVDARWRQLLGDDLRAWARDLLRATTELAECYPKLAGQPGSYRPYRVVHHAAGDVVGVCPVDGRVELTVKDLVVYELDVRELAGRLADALGLRPGYAEVDDPPSTYRVGALRPTGDAGGADREVWAYLCFPDGPVEFHAALTTLAATWEGPVLVLTPTRDSWGQPVPAGLRGRVTVDSLDRVVAAGDAPGRVTAAADVWALLGPIAGSPGTGAASPGSPPGRSPLDWAHAIIKLKAGHPGLSKAQAARLLGCDAGHFHRVLRDNEFARVACESHVAAPRHRAPRASGRRSGRITGMWRQSDDREND